MNSFKLNKDKAVNSLLYVINELEKLTESGKADKHKTYKILYFADQKHLSRYGRPIIGDSYVKMDYGPVPSFTANVVNEEIQGLEEVTAVYGSYFIKSVQEVDVEYLSESDMECLNESIDENKDLTFPQLTNKSHDSAYNNSIWSINDLEIAKASGASKETLEYIKLQIDNDNISIC